MPANMLITTIVPVLIETKYATKKDLKACVVGIKAVIFLNIHIKYDKNIQHIVKRYRYHI